MLASRAGLPFRIPAGSVDNLPGDPVSSTELRKRNGTAASRGSDAVWDQLAGKGSNDRPGAPDTLPEGAWETGFRVPKPLGMRLSER